ncbi:hypothetical protein GPECTOR_13g778 [Gonium pectorale]|uniref:HECT-type E3 ubiquitin transferase n=1 Tax=Gonium pectorale TaxID=33097 RepID=A0A150GNC2_GONPE|nr:hypothetical protein GPECTOR_13g778 [Gonium pectorale]|eukprot:KXZ51291.1 hypothetical protein GPECTOR_13g778 [Gonium pectorale]
MTSGRNNAGEEEEGCRRSKMARTGYKHPALFELANGPNQDNFATSVHRLFYTSSWSVAAAASAAKPGGSSTTSPGAGGSAPALATEAGLLKLLSHKHVTPRAKEVLRVVPEEFRAVLAKVMMTQIATELKATLAGVTHILQVLKGDPTATSPVPSSLPKAWLATGTLLSAFSEAFKAGSAPTARQGAEPGGGTAGAASRVGIAAPAPSSKPPDAEAKGAAAGDGNGAQAPAQSAARGDSPPDANDANGDAEMTDVPDAAADTAQAGEAGPKPGICDSVTAQAEAEPESDPQDALAQLLEEVSAALREAVTGAHGVSRMALLLRGEATTKFTSASAFMPAALSINELIGHLDALACVGAALGPSVTDRLRPGISSLLTSAAIKELLGAGKVYITTVIAAGALTRDLSIDAVIPQSLRNGYMAAVLTPLETGALLNERRAPQVLAYRNSITESSYYQVMDAEALPYGVNVRFEDEQEAEGMGVVREWLSQIAADLFAPERGLFIRGASDRRVVHPSPLSPLQDDYKGYMRFAGRIVGLALRANVPLGAVISTGLFKYLTGRKAGLQDLEQIDSQMYTTCQNILANPGAEASDLYHVWHTSTSTAAPAAAAGASCSGRPEVEVELLPGGSSLRVTDANKAEYVELLANYLVIGAVEEQCAAFLLGLQDTAAHLPEDARLRRAFLAPMQLDDLNRITAGESVLDPDEWMAHTDVAGFDSEEEQDCLDMFWQLVGEYSPEDRQRLLQLADPAAAAAGARGPSLSGDGPRSHRLDGDGLDGDDADQEEGGEEPVESRAPQPAGQAGPQAAATATAGAGPQAAAAVATAPQEGGQAAASAGGPAAPAPDAAHAAAAAGAGARAASAAPSADGGDGGEVPYAEEEYDEGGEGDGMDYGDEEGEDEEFQRQLAMALALSLQEMPPAEQAPQGGPAGGQGSAGPSGGGAGPSSGDASGAGPSDGGTGSSASDDNAAGATAAAAGYNAATADATPPADATASGGGDGSQVEGTFGEAQPAAGDASGAGVGSEGGASAEAPHEAGEAVPAADAPNTETVGTSAQPATADVDGDTEMNLEPAAPAAAGGDAADAPAPAPNSAQDNSAALATASAPTGAGAAAGPAGAEVSSAEARHTGVQLAEEGIRAAAPALQDDMETGVASDGATGGAAGAPEAGADGARTVSEAAQGPGDRLPPAAAGADGTAAASGAAGDEVGEEEPRQDAPQSPAPGHGAAPMDVASPEPPPAAPPSQLQHALERQPQEAAPAGDAGTGAAPMDVEAADAAQESAPAPAAEAGASAPSAEAAVVVATPVAAPRVAPLLPQARTCFLQLNLPVYESLEDMRRAFSIALDNMSFGLH